MNWFDTARFGMFIHWGHYSQQGIEASWPLVGGVSVNEAKDISVEQYHASAATFNPTAWDPHALAARAKRCGMQYAVFTTKHHDGYAMFHTKTSQHSIEHRRTAATSSGSTSMRSAPKGCASGCITRSSTGTTRITLASARRTSPTA
jgi:alpha-L-fucosidase